MEIIIKTFVTPKGRYVYDRETNIVFGVNPMDFEAFQRIENRQAKENDYTILKKYQVQGLCQASNLTSIEHPLTRLIDTYLHTRVAMVTLQVTQNCNLRCRYCIYSGNYENQRTHSNKTMSEEVMKKSIDFIMLNSNALEEIWVGFYGGEPLLELERIKSCICYIADTYAGKKVNYTLTTNATLLNDQNIRFFIESGMNVLVSFDGPKELHDKNRVYANGKGSFDDIIRKLEHIQKHYPEFYKNIGFSTVIAPENDLKCIKDFYNASSVLTDNYITRSVVNANNIKNDLDYNDQFFIAHNYEYMKMLLSELGLYPKIRVSNLFKHDFSHIKRFHKSLGKSTSIPKTFHPGGPCVPGIKRPFIDINGNIYPCERVNEESEIMRIGNVFTGFDIDKVKALLNIAQITENECIRCWNFTQCTLCAASADGNTSLSKQLRLSHCTISKSETLNKLKIICLLNENDYDFEGAIYNE